MVLLCIFKKFGIYSRDCYSFLFKKFKIKVGHCGTLDKYARGLLLVVTGNSTKLSCVITKFNKTYFFTLIFHCDTFSNDIYGFLNNYRFQYLKEDLVVNIVNYINSFNNLEFIQKCPLVSSKKIKGKSCYKYFLGNKKTVNNFNNQDFYSYNKVTVYTVKVCYYDCYSICILSEVSSGFYVRSFVRDIGKMFNVYTCVYNITRLKIGHFNICHTF